MSNNKFNKTPFRNPELPKNEPFPINKNAADIRRRLEEKLAERELKHIANSEVWDNS